MALSPAQMTAAIACRRMLEDREFQAVLDAVVEESAGRALFLDRPEEREPYRQMVLAVARIRQELEARAELPEAEAVREAVSRSFE